MDEWTYKCMDEGIDEIVENKKNILSEKLFQVK